MIENFEESGHGLMGPHWERSRSYELPDEFTPLRLEVQSLEEAPESILLEVARPEAVVGRHTAADVRLAFPDISRRHCRLSFQEGYWHIVDLNSLNGLFVNGERIQEAVLQEGDLIRLGCVTLSVQSPAEEAAFPDNAILRNIADNLEYPPSRPPLAA